MANKTNNVMDIHRTRSTVHSQAIHTRATSGKVRTAVDGFRPSRPMYEPKAAPVKTVKPAHQPAQHVAPHKPIPSKTLMRTAVKKPQIQSPDHIKAQTRTDILARVPNQTVTPKLSIGAINPSRQKKATQMLQNPSVSRYGSVTDPSTSTFVAEPPQSRQVHDFQPRQTSYTIHPLQVAEAPTDKPHRDIFTDAMARATSHEQTFDDKTLGRQKSGHVAVLLSVLTCLLLVAGVLAYTNVPSLSVRMASSRAGFPAKLPSYSPMGYSFGNLSYGPGNVTVSYKQDATHKFDITQRSSTWDSQALLSNFVASANKAYQTYERAGRTIYFFGNNTATWVDNGVWYTVNGNNSLSKNQLLDLASSI